jgi:hypothetical protein
MRTFSNAPVLLASFFLCVMFVTNLKAVEGETPNTTPPKSGEPKPKAAEVETSPSTSAAEVNLTQLCVKSLVGFQGPSENQVLSQACSHVEQLPGCTSVDGTPIFHFDKKGTHSSHQKILVFSLIHGDENPAGSAVRMWLERLSTIEPRNSWRVVPVLNPDGVLLKTRTNAHKVDLNRNFPTADWNTKAMEFWDKDSHKNARRFPGPSAGSEPETQCALKHLEDFKPDMVVSIHTPLKVLDFDGPAVKPPKFDYLPWKSLGNYPGSLGRYMWIERKVPVLTMELKEDLPSNSQPILQLQDIIGFLVSLEIGPKSKAPKK